jgi:hypothetical protein
MNAGRVRRSPFLTVVAAALVLSVFGTGTAVAGGLITSARIKNGTIKSVDVRDGALSGADVRNGSLTGGHLRDGSVTGADVKDGSLSPTDRGVYFADVWNDGTLGNSSGGVTVTKPIAAGRYIVDFGRDVGHCSYTGTVGEYEAGSTVGVVAGLSEQFENPEGVYVMTSNMSGTPANLPFHLIVVC